MSPSALIAEVSDLDNPDELNITPLRRRPFFALPVLAHRVLARAVALQAREFPDLVIEIEQLPRNRQIERLRAGQLDVVLAALPFSGTGLRVDTLLLWKRTCGMECTPSDRTCRSGG